MLNIKKEDFIVLTDQMVLDAIKNNSFELFRIWWYSEDGAMSKLFTLAKENNINDLYEFFNDIYSAKEELFFIPDSTLQGAIQIKSYELFLDWWHSDKGVNSSLYAFIKENGIDNLEILFESL